MSSIIRPPEALRTQVVEKQLKAAEEFVKSGVKNVMAGSVPPSSPKGSSNLKNVAYIDKIAKTIDVSMNKFKPAELGKKLDKLV